MGRFPKGQVGYLCIPSSLLLFLHLALVITACYDILLTGLEELGATQDPGSMMSAATAAWLCWARATLNWFWIPS